MRIILKLQGKIYFSLVLYTFAFALAAIVLLYVDNNYYAQILSGLPKVLMTSRSMSITIFTTAVTSLLTMLTLTFSIMMVVLTIYSSQLSPRTLQDFLENKTTQRIMGYFIGVITFSLLILFFTKPDQYDTPMLTPMLGIILFILAILVFAYLIHYISRSVQINLYIQNLTNETENLINRKEKIIADDERVSNQKLDDYKELLKEDFWEIKTGKSGFLQYYDEEKLFSYARKNNALIWCERRIGEHVLEETTIIKVFRFSSIESVDKCNEAIGRMFQIGDETNLYEDLGAGTKKLVEIAVKALSPGINDPGTAIFCIEKIGYLLQKLARVREAKIYSDPDDAPRLVVQSLPFDKLLFHHFYQIKNYGIHDLAIFDAILGALITIAAENNYLIRKEIWSFGSYIISSSDYFNKPQQEQDYIRERLYQLSRETGMKIKFDEIFTREDKA